MRNVGHRLGRMAAAASLVSLMLAVGAAPVAGAPGGNANAVVFTAICSVDGRMEQLTLVLTGRSTPAAHVVGTTGVQIYKVLSVDGVVVAERGIQGVPGDMLVSCTSTDLIPGSLVEVLVLLTPPS